MKRKTIGQALGMTNYALVFASFTILVFATTNQAYNYKKHRKSSIQDDLNKLYDNRPTISSNGEEPSPKSHRKSTNAKFDGDNELSRFSSNTGTEGDEEIASSPYFDLDNSGNVTAVLGKTAYLNCRVKNIKNQTVSWLRHKDTHLLTIGRLTYTSDLRFRAIHKMYSEDWMLEIKPTTHRDSGRYECQISTTPPTSHVVYLKIAEPKTAILGGPDIHLKEGSTMNLTCVITDSPEPPSYIFWRHDDKIISYDSPRGGVSVITEKGDITASFLVVQLARPSDAGIYTCSPAIGKAVSVNVHVLRGEYKLGLGTNSASTKTPDLLLLLPKSFKHILTILNSIISLLIPSSLCVPLLKSSLPFEPNFIATTMFSLVSLSLVLAHSFEIIGSFIAIKRKRSKEETMFKDKFSPVSSYDRNHSCTPEALLSVNTSDVKSQDDTLTTKEGGITRNHNKTSLNQYNITNAQKNSYCNNSKYTKW